MPDERRERGWLEVNEVRTHGDPVLAVACAHALARIDTDAARAALAAVDNNDEINTVTVARQGQTSNRNQTEGTP